MIDTVVNNYGSYPVVFVSGEGATLTDINGKKYIDFVAGIGVNCLGHNHPALVRALQEQVAKAIHVSNYYTSDTGVAFASALLKATAMERVFFGNSGAEANEAAIKLARKYGWWNSNGRRPRNVIVSLENSFHGRTIATLAATGQDVFHSPWFAPFPFGFRSIPANNSAALKGAFDAGVCAFLFECVQGEGGVNLIDREWLQEAVKAAREAGALVIADEVQTGMARTGTLLASEWLGVDCDIVTLAKGIAGGIPMGACLFRGDVAHAFVAGDHQSTFGGNPLACAAGLVVLNELTQTDFLRRVNSAGDGIRERIASWGINGVRDVRGKGLMLGFDVNGSAAEIKTACLDAGLCVSTAGEHVVRLLPPLVIRDDEIEAGLTILKGVLERAL
jgi:acetylornithine/N-succinyldiaminopimelate aminotransferase